MFSLESKSPEQIKQLLSGTILALPSYIDHDDAAGGVLRPWVRRQPLRFQGVLLTAIRGCDGASKEDNSKSLSRMIRRAVMNPADPRETLNSGGFFGFNPDKLLKDCTEFFHSLDQYPLHYVMHLMHASQVIGYAHPDGEMSHFFQLIYELFVHTMHLRPEPGNEMEARLTEDRVAKGTTARNF